MELTRSLLQWFGLAAQDTLITGFHALSRIQRADWLAEGRVRLRANDLLGSFTAE